MIGGKDFQCLSRYLQFVWNLKEFIKRNRVRTGVRNKYIRKQIARPNQSCNCAVYIVQIMEQIIY